MVWEKSHRLALRTYRLTRNFPVDERFGLTTQMRRAVASIAANIAEGCGRNGNAELCRFLRIAAGSASELEYHILLAHDLGFLRATDHEELTGAVVEIKRMLTAFLKKLTAES